MVVVETPVIHRVMVLAPKTLRPAVDVTYALGQSL